MSDRKLNLTEGYEEIIAEHVDAVLEMRRKSRGELTDVECVDGHIICNALDDLYCFFLEEVEALEKEGEE